MAVRKRSKIIVVKEDFAATDVADTEVSAVVSGGNVMDAVSMLSAETEMDDKAVLASNELNIVTAKLTDKEAKDLAGKPGIEAVEDDEEVRALSDFPAEDDDLGGTPVPPDPEAAAEIDAMEFADDWMSDFSDEDAAAYAAQDAQRPMPVSDIEFDDMGALIGLDDEPDPGMVAAGDAAGIPRDKLVKLVRCILKCAISELTTSEADVTEAQVAALLAQHGVAPSAPGAVALRDYITYGLRLIYAQYAWRFSTGAGVRVAVVDTGIAPRHPDLRVYGGASFVSGTSWADDNGHGTHVAGTIAALRNGRGVVGVAPHARLYAVKVLAANGSGTTSGVLNGLAWCYRYNMHVVNLSLGSAGTTHDRNVYSRAYEQAGRRLRRRGILPVAAAGNNGARSNPYVGNPARCPSYMAVASVDRARRRSSFSSYGPQVEIAAPGSDIPSTWPQTGYRTISGTSMATPHVAGVAALVKRRNPGWSGDRIRVHLWRTSRDLGSPGRDWLYGYGLVNAYGAVR